MIFQALFHLPCGFDRLSFIALQVQQISIPITIGDGSSPLLSSLRLRDTSSEPDVQAFTPPLSQLHAFSPLAPGPVPAPAPPPPLAPAQEDDDTAMEDDPNLAPGEKNHIGGIPPKSLLLC